MGRSGFFDAKLINGEYDRVYLAQSFADYFASFIGNGIFGGKSEQLQVTAMETPVMQVAVRTGQAYINGYWFENNAVIYLPIDFADGVLDRIDSVVLRWGLSERDMWLMVKKGTPAINAIAPQVTRTADYYELQLATINIPKGTVNIKAQNIVDTRLDTNVCGYVVGLITQFDTTTFGYQLQAFINSYMAEMQIDYNQFVTQISGHEQNAQLIYDAFEAAITAFEVGAQVDFEAWFETIRGILDDEAAGNLLNLILALTARTDKLELTVFHDDITDYSYQFLFDTIDDINAAGFWNESLQRIEC